MGGCSLQQPSIRSHNYRIPLAEKKKGGAKVITEQTIARFQSNQRQVCFVPQKAQKCMKTRAKEIKIEDKPNKILQ